MLFIGQTESEVTASMSFIATSGWNLCNYGTRKYILLENEIGQLGKKRVLPPQVPLPTCLKHVDF